MLLTFRMCPMPLFKRKLGGPPGQTVIFAECHGALGWLYSRIGVRKEVIANTNVSVNGNA